MAMPVVKVASGGLPVTISATGRGSPMEIAASGRGTPVTVVASGGLPIVDVGGGLGGAFSPANLTGLIGWYDASIPGSYAFNSGVDINTWADQSGAGNHLSWWGFGRPTYNATGFNGNKPATMFTTAVGSAMNKTSFPMGSGNTLTAFVVSTAAAASSNGNARWLAYSKPASNDFDNVGSWNLSAGSVLTTKVDLQRNGVSASFTTTPSPAPHRLIATIDPSGVMTMYVDGVASTTATVSGNWVTGGILAMGSLAGAGFSAHLTAPIFEAGVATGYHGPATVAQLDTYLKNHAGL